MSEIIVPETHFEEYNPLLYEMRSLLYDAKQGDVLSDFTVTDHTDTRTIMSNGDPMESIVHLVIEDTSKGILARCLWSRAIEDAMITRDNTVLLSTPTTSMMLSETRVTMAKRMYKPSHDVNEVLGRVNTEFTPLTHTVMSQWFTQVHDLWESKPERSSPLDTTPPNVSHLFFSHLFKRHVSRV